MPFIFEKINKMHDLKSLISFEDIQFIISFKMIRFRYCDSF